VNYKFGRLPRAFDPRIPRLGNLLGAVPPPPPIAVDYTQGMPSSLGEMLNDTEGDCTCAAYGHAKQVWSFNGSPPMRTLPDADIQVLYEAVSGYVPGDPSTDQGAVEQDVLAYLLNTGLAGNKLAAYVEVNPKNLDNVKRAIAWCGVAYIGINIPAYLMAGGGPPQVWAPYPDGDQTILGGHAVVLAGYDADCAKVISWGRVYSMAWGFFSTFTDEVYALVDSDWFTLSGASVAGLTLAQLVQQMQELKE
jgi:hypothetical protein